MKLLRLLANLGYGSRKEVTAMFRDGRVTDSTGEVLYGDDLVDDGTVGGASVLVDGEPLDPPPGLMLLLHKPVGVTCSHKDAGRLVYDLLPPRFRLRKPALSSVGRLDRDTSGLLLFTDDGALLHRIISPKAKVPKVYEAQLAQDLRGDEAERLASGTLMLDGETDPLLPATLEVVSPRQARVTVTEGRYHLVRRLFAALGNHVQALHRSAVGGLTLDGLQPGEWRVVAPEEVRTRLLPETGGG